MGSIYKKDVKKGMRAWIGYKEGDNNWNIFAKYLDDCFYFDPQYKQNLPWCAIFQDCIFLLEALPKDRDDEAKKYDAQYVLYQPSKNNYSAGAREMAGYFKDAGAWYDEPEEGDLIFFDYGSGIAHVGFVEEVDGCITTIEGNAGDMVQRKWYDFDDSRIAGFGRPRYDEDDSSDEDDDDEKPEPTPTPAPEEPCAVNLRVLSRGSTGEQVNTLKALLNEFGYAVKTYNGEPMPLDGDFDYDTEQAVYRFQENHGMEKNGIVDEKFWNLLLK
jgi:hypothetical protein